MTMMHFRFHVIMAQADAQQQAKCNETKKNSKNFNDMKLYLKMNG